MNSQRAFTFIEWMVTLAIIAILAAMVFPNLTMVFDQATNDIIQKQLAVAIDQAKQASQNRFVPIALCQANEQQRCITQGHAVSLLVFIDKNGDGTLFDKSQLIAVIQFHVTTGELHMRQYPYYRGYFLFHPIGTQRSDNGTFWYCPRSRTAPVWAIMINKAGRARVAYPNAQGDITDSQGKRLSCAI
jgi:prepilin-type N-terminal cleavage/methylation domain-containing protein